MRNKNRVFTIYAALFVLLAVAAVTMRTVALFLHFDENHVYFSEKTLVNVADYILVAACILFITYIFTAGKEVKLIPNFTSSATYIPTGIVSVALVFMEIALVRRLYATAKNISYLKTVNPAEAASERLVLIVLIIAAILALFSIIHFALTALVETNSSQKRANFGLCTVMFLAIYTIYLYFSSALPINAPNKMLDEMVYLFSAVFFLYETRLSLGRERWRQYIAFGFIAAIISAYASIPAIIYYFAGGAVISNSIYEVVLSFALFVFITARIFLTTRLIEDKASSFVSALAFASDTRKAAVSPKVTLNEVIDVVGEALEADKTDEALENQISIDDSELAVPGESAEKEAVQSTEEKEEPTEDAE